MSVQFEDIKARMYAMTFANTEIMAKRLSHNGKLGFAPLQLFKKGSPGNPQARPLVHCFADKILARHRLEDIAALLPEYEARSRQARAAIEARNTGTTKTETVANVATAIGFETVETASTAHMPETVETDTPPPAGSLDAIIRDIIRRESERAAHNGQAATNASDVARIAQALIDSAIEQARLPRQTHVVIHKEDETGRVETTNLGVQHNQFPRLLALVQKRIAANSRRVNVWLPGPAGSGKTTAAQTVARALSLPFYYTGAIMDETKVFGYRNANGDYIETDFFKAYTQGGVFLWDEADGSDPMVSVMLNAAVDGMLASFPHGMFTRHPDFIFIAAANTYGMGANDKYVGRNRLDAATLDRFVKLGWDYCPELEKVIVADDLARDTMLRIRKAVSIKQLDVIISTRAGMRHQLLRGMPDLYNEQEALEIAYRDGMTADQWRQVTLAAGITIGTVRELAA